MLPRFFALIVLLSLVIVERRARATAVTLTTHVVRPNEYARVYQVAAGALPTDAHPDGTVYALVYERRETSDAAAGTESSYVAELDVRRGATIHRSDLDCSAILVDGPRVFAACGRETIELDRSLTIVWRASAVGCTSNGEIAFASGLFFDGTRHLVTLYGCDRAALIRTVDTGAHTIVGEAIGPFSVDHSTSIWFHGAIVLGLSIAPGVGYEKQTLFVLSPDYARVEKTLDTGRGASIDDDGTNIRVSLSSEKAQSIRLFDHAVHATAWTRPRWLALDREIVLSDTLVAVSSRQLDATTHPAIPQTVTYSPTVAGGQRIIRQLDHGSVHLWLTQECCGGGRRVPPGLYAGRVDRPVKVEND